VNVPAAMLGNLLRMIERRRFRLYIVSYSTSAISCVPFYATHAAYPYARRSILFTWLPCYYIVACLHGHRISLWED